MSSKNIHAVVEKVTSMARQYYDDDHDDGGGLIGLIGLLVIGFIFIVICIPIFIGIIGFILSLFTGGLNGLGLGGGQAGGVLNIPLATLNANQPGRRRRSAGIGMAQGFNFKNALTTLEKAYKAYTESN